MMQKQNLQVKLLSKKVADEALLTQRKINSTKYILEVDENVSPPKKSCLVQSISCSENFSAKKKRIAPAPPSASPSLDITQFNPINISEDIMKSPTRVSKMAPTTPATVKSLKYNSELSEPVNAPPKPPRVFDSPIENEISKPIVLSDEEESELLYPLKELPEIKIYKEKISSPLKILNRNKPVPTLVVTDIVDRRVSRDPLGDIIILDEKSKFKLIELQELLNYETSIIHQTMKALQQCQNNLNSRTSKSIVECQMLLLMASKRRAQLMIRMQKLRLGLKNDSNNCKSSEGKLIISNIKLPLRNIDKKDEIATDSVDAHYFILMVRCEEEVKFTSLRSTEDQSITGWLEFNDPIEFSNVLEDSSVDVEIYSTLISIVDENSSKSKSPHKMFSMPKNILSKKLKNDRAKCFSLASNINKIGQIRTFALITNSKIKILNDTKVESFFEKAVGCNCVLADRLVYDISFKLDVNLHMAGFLTMFEMVQGFGAWHRRWFQLTRASLKYWNYPTDCHDDKIELGSLDLRLCTSTEIGLVSRDLCARPNTFQVQFNDEEVWLSADNSSERIQWCQVLNQQLSLLKKA